MNLEQIQLALNELRDLAGDVCNIEAISHNGHGHIYFELATGIYLEWGIDLDHFRAGDARGIFNDNPTAKQIWNLTQQEDNAMNVESLDLTEALKLQEELKVRIAELERSREKMLWKKVLDAMQQYEAECGNIGIEVEDISDEKAEICVDIFRSASTPGQLQWN